MVIKELFSYIDFILINPSQIYIFYCYYEKAGVTLEFYSMCWEHITGVLKSFINIIYNLGYQFTHFNFIIKRNAANHYF